MVIAYLSVLDIFLGQMLLNWFLSSFADNSPVKNVLNAQDLKAIGIQYCTYLLAAGVLRQIPDKDAPPEVVFKVSSLMLLVHPNTHYYVFRKVKSATLDSLKNCILVQN